MKNNDSEEKIVPVKSALQEYKSQVNPKHQMDKSKLLL